MTHRAAHIPILGQDTYESLELIKRITQVCVHTRDAERLCAKYKAVFTGIGEHVTEYHIEVVDTPRIKEPARQVSYAWQEKLQKTLEKPEQPGIIASVDRPTDWVSNLVMVAKKKGLLQICLDSKELIIAIRRETYHIPIPADVHAKFSGATTFVVPDMKSAFWRMRLYESSSYLCTYSNPGGRKAFLRIPFGIVLQKCNAKTFGNISVVHIITDDLIKNVKLNSEKLQYRVNKVHYMGNVVST